MPLYFSEMTSDEVGQAAGAGALALIPVGAIEAHGPHLPTGTDSLIADEVARRLAGKLQQEGVTSIIMPTIPFSVADCARGFPGTVSIRGETLQALLIDIGRGLLEDGFQRAAILCFHLEPANAEHINQAVDIIRRDVGLEISEVFVSNSNVWLPRLRGILQYRLRQDLHGGEMETSIMLAVRPDLVRESWRSLPPTEVDLIATAAAGIPFKDVGPGYFGAPALSAEGKGDSIMSLLVATTTQAVRELLGRTEIQAS